MGKSGAIGSQVCAAVHFILLSPQANSDLLYHVSLHFSPHWLDNLLPFMNKSSDAQHGLGFFLIIWIPCFRRHSGTDSHHPWGAAPPVTSNKLLLESTVFHLSHCMSARPLSPSAGMPRTLMDASVTVQPWPFSLQPCSLGHKVEITTNGLSFPRSSSP